MDTVKVCKRKQKWMHHKNHFSIWHLDLCQHFAAACLFHSSTESYVQHDHKPKAFRARCARGPLTSAWLMKAATSVTSGSCTPLTSSVGGEEILTRLPRLFYAGTHQCFNKLIKPKPRVIHTFKWSYLNLFYLLLCWWNKTVFKIMQFYEVNMVQQIANV